MLDQLDPTGLHEVLNAGTIALPDPDEPEMLELLEGFSERRAVDAQAFRELAFGRQLRTRRVLAVQDQGAQLFGDLLGDTLLLDRFEHPRARGYPGRVSSRRA